MAFINLNTKTVVCNLVELTGGIAEAGSVVFAASDPIFDTAGHQVITPTAIPSTLDGSGNLTVTVPCCDDPDTTTIDGSPWTYTVTIMTVGLRRSYSNVKVSVSDPSTVQLDTLLLASAAFTPPILTDPAQPIVGQNTSSLSATWTLALSTASFLDTASMGTLKTLGTPGGNASEIEWDGVLPTVADDGTISCTTGAPTATQTSTLYGATATSAGSTWTTPNNATGAADTNRAVFTSAVANAVGTIDLSYDFSSVPSGATVTSVVIDLTGISNFADSDTVMPYTYEFVNGSGTHVGSAAQVGNNAGPLLTFTGIAYSDLATLKSRVKITHNNSVTSSAVRIDSVPVVVHYSPAAHYRSEVVFTSDRTDGSNDYTVMRFHPTDRIRVAFDVLTYSLNTQDSQAWNVLFQGIGKSVNGAFPNPNISLVAETGQFALAGGQAVTYSEAPSRQTHEDGRWYRWELDILLGGPGAGKVNAWLDGVQVVTNWFPTSGTYYAGNGNNSIDLQYIYFKNGLYGQEFAANAYTPKAVFRNRRFSATVSGVTTTWRGPQNHGPGLHVYRRNPTTDMPY